LERWFLASTILVGSFLVLRLVKAVLRNRANRIAERFDSSWARGLAGTLDALRWWFLLAASVWIASLVLDLGPEHQGLVVLRAAVSIVLILQAAVLGGRFIAFAADRYGQERFAEDPAGRTMLSAVGFLGRLALWNYNRFMDVQQAVNLLLLRRFAEAGIEFAYPTQTLYLARTRQSEAAA
jgi:small-conductance mechanosensitive channel